MEKLVVLLAVTVLGGDPALLIDRTCVFYPESAVSQNDAGVWIKEEQRSLFVPATYVTRKRQPTETVVEVCEGGGQPIRAFLPQEPRPPLLN